MLWWGLQVTTTFKNLDIFHFPTVSKSFKSFVDNKAADHLEKCHFFLILLLFYVILFDYILTTVANKIDKTFNVLGPAWAVALDMSQALLVRECGYKCGWCWFNLDCPNQSCIGNI